MEATYCVHCGKAIPCGCDDVRHASNVLSDAEWHALGALLANPPLPPQWLLDAVLGDEVE
jgi:hypothetical protein